MSQDAFDLSWELSDVEHRLGLRCGLFTGVNNKLAVAIAILLTLAFYGIVSLSNTWLTRLLTERGPTQYAVMFLSFWSLCILGIKWTKLQLQRKSLDIDIIESDGDFTLTPQTASQVVDHVRSTIDQPERFVLFHRIFVALSNLKNIGRISDVDEILRSQADQDVSVMETSYSLLRSFIWAIPVLGFIGTVLGLSTAIGEFSAVLTASGKDLSGITDELAKVTDGLSTAFETTLLALVMALVLQMLMTFIKTSEEEFLDACTSYCLRNVVNRLRILQPDLVHEKLETHGSSTT